MAPPVRAIVAALAAASAATTFAQSSSTAWKPAKSPLTTRWSKEVSPKNALPEYPRPQMRRKEWLNLNGLWEYGIGGRRDLPAYGGKILVPYAMESALSGVGAPSAPDRWLHYRRTFAVPAKWRVDAGRRVLLHFGAVNYLSEVAVNGRPIGGHRGGYDGFSFDVTDALRPGSNEIVVRVQNPLRVDEPDAQVLGKQRRRSGGIFYTAATGIWQTVWMEPVDARHFERLKITPDLDAGVVAVEAPVASVGSDMAEDVEVVVTDGGRTVARQRYAAGATMRIAIPRARRWSPADPHLYDLKLRYRTKAGVVDEVDGYFAMRKISLGKDARGRTTILLNDREIFQVGTLDQGYWPDGLYTAPTDAALRWDVEATKRLGFNMIRKHAKTEPDRFYYWTDKLGLLVWQDMPQAYTPGENTMSEDGKRQWETEWREIMAELHNHPSIVVWTVFNEGWGQHDTPRLTSLTKEIDPSRLVNSASGWFDREVGDLDDVHSYPEPGSDLPTAARAAVNGEFGGVTMRVPGHMWTEDVMGYGTTLGDTWSVTKRYQDLLRMAYGLRESKGTCAFVYTQITDVEQESNGLLTYDREVWKADPRIVAAANRGRFLPMPPNPNPPVLATSAETPRTWRYVTTAPAGDWTSPSYSDAAWSAGPAPFGAELSGVRTPWTTGEIWLRAEVELPARLPKELDLLVFHDEDAEIYINGVLAARGTGYTTGYVTLPISAEGRAAIRPGKNLIAVHCRQTRGGQYIDLGIVRRAARRR